MPDHIPGWEADGIRTDTPEWRALAKQLTQPSMPAHRIAYYLVCIQFSLLIIGAMIWFDVVHLGPRLLNIGIAGAALACAFAANDHLRRGR